MGNNKSSGWDCFGRIACFVLLGSVVALPIAGITPLVVSGGALAISAIMLSKMAR